MTLGTARLAATETLGCSEARRPKVATPPSVCFQELNRPPISWIPANTLDQLPQQVAGKCPLIGVMAQQRGPAAAPQRQGLAFVAQPSSVRSSAIIKWQGSSYPASGMQAVKR